MEYDFIVNGAGPSGLCFAALASKNGFRCAIIEKQAKEAIEAPEFDGRDIALTHKSKEILEDLGIWVQFSPDTISTINKAIVNNGKNDGKMTLESNLAPNLAYVVSNHLVRQYAHDIVKNDNNIKIFFDNEIVKIDNRLEFVNVSLNDGTNLNAKVLIAADSRFSTIRKRYGISASMLDFGKTMVVCRIKHEISHEFIANECFGNGYTLALLPLNENVSSAVITMKPNQIDELLAKSDKEFTNWIQERFEKPLGKIELISEKFAYPLVGVYANSFIAPRFATIGDAAVGMHPVTAHGFNFGLLSITTLMNSLIKAKKRNQDIGSAQVLGEYNRKHRLDTLPLYLTTASIVNLYTNDTLPASLARKALINIADKMAPIKALMMNKLVDNGRSFLPKLPFLN
ncbi:MAG: 5-demethoxyubiquinol-8 5-hydroxylase UbiM [Caulobacterales bacterium]|nr:5-demethoxyubiquinol-8 5-hydroxylase UbiM [Caulobacterales bacterium]MCA0372086.1 5-demethoxyubiquinol-8 5-hydroxylase UbiM [Pseudomonadota bacterium]